MNPQMNDDQSMSLSQPQSGAATTMPLPPAMSNTTSPDGQAPQALPLLSMEPPLSANPVVLQPTVPVHSVESRSVSTAIQTPAEAADSDVIEKEWVIKAKEIVAATQQDPYKQVQEINKLKADYMKKRYDKDIKLADE